MKMVASVKFRKAQMNVVAARPYARKIGEILKTLIPNIEEIDNPLLKEREIKKICVVVVTSDRGLCGSFNTNLIKLVEHTIKGKYAEFYNSKNIAFFAIGKKGFDHFNKRGYEIFGKFVSIFDKLKFIDAKHVVDEIIKGYLEKRYDKVIVIYNEFKSVAQSKIVEEQLLPIPSFEAETDGSAKTRLASYIFEPSCEEIVNNLVPRHLNTQIWRILLESYASEQAAQMTAMDSATTNANDLMKTLQLQYNRARQAAITKEILEIVGGAEALQEAK